MKTLIAGGAGFIGSHLADVLIKEGHSVVAIDNFINGTRKNVEHLSSNPHFQLIEMDVSDMDAMDKLFQEQAFDYVFHLAANSDIQKSATDPSIDNINTYLTTYTICECMRRNNVKNLFFASTSAVYGEKRGADVNESATMEPISYYGAGKMASEAVINAFTYMNDFHSLIFRFPNVIGPRLTHGVIFDFIHKLQADNHNLEILGNGKQCKPYIHVYDLVNAINEFKDVDQGVTLYNIGVESQTSVDTIANIICKQMGLQDVQYHYTGGNGGWKGDVPVFAYDLSKIHATGWQAHYTSDEAVEHTVSEVLACAQ
jgi:UDP-glucose 4-epimerase